MAQVTDKKTVLIAGPTASGKSAAALAIAERLGGEIVNADAIQVYRDLRILSARPTKAETARAPHRLYGHVDGGVRYSAGEWLRDAEKAISDIHARGRAAIIVGGTGLYFRALEMGLAETPAISPETRDAAARRFEAIGAAAFRAEILGFDPAMARLDPADRQRHVRAWEVFHETGTSLSAFQNAPTKPVVADAVRLLIMPPRAALYRAVEERFDRMLTDGALEEARALLGRGFDPGLPVMKAVGAAELIVHLQGALSLGAAVDLARRNSRRFAKRQMTWFRGQAPHWRAVASAPEAVAAVGVATHGPGG